MDNKKRASTGLAAGGQLRAAIRCTLAERRSALRVGAGLVALGLATQPVLAAPFPAEIELSSLQTANGGNGSAGFVLNGIDSDDRSGFSVSAAGDVNGDGIDDLLIGARYADQGSHDRAGESYVVFGRQTGFSAEFELSSLRTANGGNGSVGFILKGIDSADRSGTSVSTAGDVNGDGIDDLVVGANLADTVDQTDNAGQSYVFFGRAQTTFPAEFELSSLRTANGGNGSAGFVLNGVDAGDRSGISVSGAGDVNGDGIDDLLVSAYIADPGGRTSAGQSYVVFGRDQTAFPAELELSSLLSANGGNGSVGFVLNGIDAGDQSGNSVSAAGDVNGDGIDDLIIGAEEAQPDGRTDDIGESYVVFGRDINLGDSFAPDFELSSLLLANGGNGSVGFVLNGIDGGDHSGSSVSAAGDVNDDGIDDLLVGARSADPDGRAATGQSNVVFGRDQTAGNFPAEFELASLQTANGGNGSAGFVLNGIEGGDRLGISVSAAGDVNGDGIDDLLVGADGADRDGGLNVGESYVVFGRDQTAFPAEFELSSLEMANGGNGSVGVVLKGIDALDTLGISVSAAGDVNGDGIDDLLVGADDADPGDRNQAGESYVVFGQPSDTDSDGVADFQDNCPTVSNPGQADGDGDGVGNVCDNCTTIANPTQCDTNSDGFGNHCDADLNNNGGVTATDLGIFRSQFGMTGNDIDADLNCNGGVTGTDLGLFRSLFNRPPGPSAVAP